MKKSFVLILISFVLVAGGLYLFSNSSQKESIKKKFPKIMQQQLNINEPALEVSETQSVETEFSAQPVQLEKSEELSIENLDRLDQASQDQIQKCIPGITVQTHLNDMSKEMLSALGATRKTESLLKMANYTLLMKNGDKRVLQVLPLEGVSGLGVRLFALDNENLPIPVKLDAKYKNLSTKEVVNDLLKENVLKKQEAQIVERYDNNSSVEILKVNQKTVGLQIQMSSGNFLDCGFNRNKGATRCNCVLK